MSLSVGLPWFRAVPRTAIEELEVFVNGTGVQVTSYNGQTEADFFEESKEWFPQDRVKLTWAKRDNYASHVEVKVSMKIVIPNLLTPEGKPIVIPTSVIRNIDVRES